MQPKQSINQIGQKSQATKKINQSEKDVTETHTHKIHKSSFDFGGRGAEAGRLSGAGDFESPAQSPRARATRLLPVVAT